MSTQWLHATTTLQTWALACLLLAAALAVASLGYQTWRCGRRHVDIRVIGYDDDSYAEWDDPASPDVPAEGGREHEKAAS